MRGAHGGPRQVDRIVSGQFIIQAAAVGSGREPFHQPHVGALGRTRLIGQVPVNPRRGHDQRVAVPLADGITQRAGRLSRRIRRRLHVDGAYDVVLVAPQGQL